MNISFRKAELKDCNLLIEINNKSYLSDYKRFGQCPGYNISLDRMKEAVSNKNIEKNIIYSNDIPVGAMSLQNLGNHKYYLGNLCIIPKYQHKGIGKKAIDYILSYYSDLKELTLITPADKIENVTFYTKKCGFKITGIEMDGKVKVYKFEYRR